jgi:Uma2 family endonuclease
MSSVVIQSHNARGAAPEAVRIPEWARGSLASFRRWATSDDFPERGWYAYLEGDLWVDLSMETLGHNQVKTKIGAVLTLLADDAGIGRFLGDRMRLTNVDAELSTQPDGMFISDEAVKRGRVRLEQGEESLEVQGTPDMVLEVVSPTSEEKDTVILRDLYWRAGVPEYWLADPRGDAVAFDILRRGRKGYAAARKQAGWVKSSVFGKSFRLTRRDDAKGYPVYALHVK